MTALNTLDTVANLNPIPTERLTLIEVDHSSIQQLPAGQVGTVLQVYKGETPHYLVEFADLRGREYAMAVLQVDELIVLHYELVPAMC